MTHDASTRLIARELWQRFETIHAVTYFTDEARQAMKGLGLRRYWMGYFAGRASPMGAVSAGLVTAVFYGFSPEMVAEWVPDVWDIAAPEDVVAARADGAASALRRLVADVESVAESALPSLLEMVDSGSEGARPLFSSNRALPRLADPVAAMWQATTALREHRGDGHNLALRIAGVGPCECHILMTSAKGMEPRLLRDNRGWTETAWGEATESMAARGILAGARLSEEGRSLWEAIEARTDDLAAEVIAPLPSGEAETLVTQLDSVAAAIAANEGVPFPNPIGVPSPAAG